MTAENWEDFDVVWFMECFSSPLGALKIKDPATKVIQLPYPQSRTQSLLAFGQRGNAKEDAGNIKSRPQKSKKSIERFYMTSRRPYWCSKTMKRLPCWCSKPILWELNSFLMQTLSNVPINLHRCWTREWKRSINLMSSALPRWPKSQKTLGTRLPHPELKIAANVRKSRVMPAYVSGVGIEFSVSEPRKRATTAWCNTYF